ncbi:nucleoside-diphosphate sugar epimerase/dehydratase [Runella sp. MFBS21]|uniref:polysaccharide biosynthesis protein n=1 Tax=Runella sp. MFBS21 TaxID=3034018 RepID=UPI0023F7CEA3|nr:nucleoside-diphosphate sugar epimerase/dehydratase [Runella sp. MFBS21]MDF7819436.1 nucleoside-diphosphate sugar epimerase/dehydratase [Runella sp. MFBS21]
MIERFLSSYSNRFVSRYLILAIDGGIVVISFVIACILRFNLKVSDVNWALYKYYLLTLFISRLLCFIYFRSYSGIVRHTSVEDTSLIFKAITLSSFLTIVTSSFLTYTTDNYLFYIPISILIIEYFISLFLMVASRFLVKDIYKTLIANAPGEKVDVLIYGAGALGILTKNTLLRNRYKKYNIVGFIDDNASLNFKTVEGVQVYPESEAIHRFIKDRTDTNLEVVLAIQHIKPHRKNEIIENFLKQDVVVKVVPSVYEKITDQQLKSSEIRPIRIEDLLEREPIQIDNQNISLLLAGKIAMVTGAAGSIGSEIARQLVRFRPKILLLLDQSESGLYDLENELKQHFRQYLDESTDIVVQVADITDEIRMRYIFEHYRPQFIFHAAAYKHVPLMEEHPYEAVKVNVFGSKIVADLAVEMGVIKFVMISTDKAVNPTNVMGATKRLAEMYVQSLNNRFNSTRFITTRFGNVLGSNGSVVPLFQKQIQAGGPLTVTHPEVIRYFMTISEACQLVLEAGSMGKGGEIFVFDMGEPVKIADLAQKMIKLSGLSLGKDIEIQYTGLRPGEKLYEELLSDKEHTLPTYHSKIQIAKVYTQDFNAVSNALSELKKILKDGDKALIVNHLKITIPEFISNNSIYETLDDLELQ